MKLNRIFIGVHVQFLLRFSLSFPVWFPNAIKLTCFVCLLIVYLTTFLSNAEYVATIERVISKG
jgi:hypothetical protein